MYDLWSERHWWHRPALERVLGGGADKTLGYAYGPGAAPEFAFLAVRQGGAQRAAIVVEPERAIVVHTAGEKLKNRSISDVDIEGVVAGQWAMLFHTDPALARSAVSFDTSERDAAVRRYVVAGLAPGEWQVWRNGWLEDLDGFVNPGECVLYFERAPGSFFLRRLA